MKNIVYRQLFNRLVTLSYEYFNEYTTEDIQQLIRTMDDSLEYSSDELINTMEKYSDEHNLRRIA